MPEVIEMKRKEAERKKIEKEMKKWRKNVKEIKEIRSKKINEYNEKIDLETKTAKKECEENRDKYISDAEEKIKILKEKIREKELEQASLGIFRILRKKEIIKNIEELEINIKTYEQGIGVAKKNCIKKIKEIEKTAQENKAKYESEIKNEYPIPQSPEELKEE